MGSAWGKPLSSTVHVLIEINCAGQKTPHKLLPLKGQKRIRSLSGKYYGAPALVVRFKTSCAGQKTPHKQLQPKGQNRVRFFGGKCYGAPALVVLI